MQKSYLLSFLVFTLLFYLSIETVNATKSVSFSNLSSSIDQNEELEIDASLLCSKCGDSYLRGVFYSSGTKYFGLTMNNNKEWIGVSSDKTKYFLVPSEDIKEGSWSGKLRVKPDPDSSYYSGPGSYYFKVARYTPSGSATWSKEETVYITGPTPTSESTPEPVPESTSTPTQTPTPTPTNTPTPIVKAKKTTKTPTPTIEGGEGGEGGEDGVLLGLRDELSPTPTPESESEKGGKFPLLAGLFMTAGLGFIGAAGYPLLRDWKKRYNIKDGERKEKPEFNA